MKNHDKFDEFARLCARDRPVDMADARAWVDAAFRNHGKPRMIHKPWRSRGYLDWISEQPCCVTGRPGPSDPHHIKRTGFGGSSKCDDIWTIPLCHELHHELHQIGWKSWEKKHQTDQLLMAVSMINKALRDGVLSS